MPITFASVMSPARAQTGGSGMPLDIAIGVMAFNEDRNIARHLDSILRQTSWDRISRVFVVASGCTDRTCEIVSEYSAREPKIELVAEEVRGGKVSGINTFLRYASEPILVLSGADMILEPQTIEALVAPLAEDAVGVVGAHPVPDNRPDTFFGFATNLMWRLHHDVSKSHPKMGELVAFRNAFEHLKPSTLGDEVQIEYELRNKGYASAYAQEATIHNRGPENFRDFVKQRTRCNAANLQVMRDTGLVVSTMRVANLARATIAYVRDERPRLDWLAGTAALELACRAIAFVDFVILKSRSRYQMWDQIDSTKALAPEHPAAAPSPAR